MHLSSMHTIILFAGLAYSDIPPAIASIDSALSSLASINGIVSPNPSASPTVSSTAVSSGVQTGIPTTETHTGAPSTTTIPVMTSSEVTVPVTTSIIRTSSSPSTMTILSSVTGTSNATVTKSTTVGTPSASKSGNHTSTTASPSPSPTESKKNDAAGHVRAFVTGGGAGIVLLGAMLAGL